jgi:hypothetical protein
MKSGKDNGTADEAAFIRHFVELTGASETAARSVFMYACCSEPEPEKTEESALRTIEPGLGQQGAAEKRIAPPKQRLQVSYA